MESITQEYLDHWFSNLFKKECSLKKILIVPPDYSRLSSGAGFILDRLCRFLFSQKNEITVDILSATGLHQSMSAKQQRHMFGDFVVQKCSFLVHHPFVEEQVAEKFLKASFSSEELKKLFPNLPDFLCDGFTFWVSGFLDPSRYDAVFSLGQVLPHEVAGMSNYTKNIVIGLGTKEFIDFSHLASALVGMNNIIGKEKNPVRALIDQAFEKIALENKWGSDFIRFLLFTSVWDGHAQLKSIYQSTNADAFSSCCEDALKLNVSTVEKPSNLVIVDLPKHYTTTWLANKSIYRLRKIVAAGGRLIVLAPHLKAFGETDAFDAQIREMGYCSAKRAMAFLQKNSKLSAAVIAHLIHGHVEDFRVIYATNSDSGVGKKDIEKVGYQHMSVEKARQLLDDVDKRRTEGMIVKDPAQGFWRLK